MRNKRLFQQNGNFCVSHFFSCSFNRRSDSKCHDDLLQVNPKNESVHQPLNVSDRIKRAHLSAAASVFHDISFYQEVWKVLAPQLILQDTLYDTAVSWEHRSIWSSVQTSLCRVPEVTHIIIINYYYYYNNNSEIYTEAAGSFFRLVLTPGCTQQETQTVRYVFYT